MGWIDEEVVTRVRVSADIVQVANHLGVPVTREGKQFWKVPCPMPGHDDWAGDGGSCLLKPQAQGNNSFFCFGCREKGTVFDFYCHVKGWDPDNADDFQRAVVALHDLFGLNLDVAGCTGVQGRAVRETLAERVVSLPLTAPLVEVDGGEYWRVGGPGLLRYLSPAERACFYNLRSFADDTVYPLTLTNIPAMGIMSLNERSGRLCGVFTRRARDRLFARQHGPAVRMCGPALSGQPVGPAVPRFFFTRVAVENPLDYLVVAGAGRPVVWGIWDGSHPRPSLSKDGFHCWVALHFGNRPESLRRFFTSITDDQLWLPRFYHANGLESLVWLSAERLDRFLAVVLTGNRPVGWRADLTREVVSFGTLV